MDSVTNYQPVAIIPVVAKVFEALIHHQVYGHLEKNGALNDVQSGFRQNCSTEDIGNSE